MISKLCVADVQKLESSMADIVTLDGRRITAKGITSGASFRVPPLSDAPCCFGSSTQAAAANAQDMQQQVCCCSSSNLDHSQADFNVRSWLWPLQATNSNTIEWCIGLLP